MRRPSSVRIPGAGGVDDACGADAKVVFVAVGADQRLAIPFRFVVTGAGAIGVDVTAVVFRLGIDFGVAVHLAGRGKEVPGVLFLATPRVLCVPSAPILSVLMDWS
jgi:hypothetical protein